MPKAMSDQLKAYNTITKRKEKFGVFRKTCLHIHTPESYDYRLFKNWDPIKYSLATDQEIYDICIEKQVFPNIFPIDSFVADGPFEIYSSTKEVLAFLLVAHQLIINKIELAIVTDHHTIQGVDKLELAIKFLCENKKNSIYPEVILGIEISCADKNHVVGFFENSFDTRKKIDNWLSENLLSIVEGSFETSREVLKYINSIDGIGYIAHIDQTDVFKENYLSGAYKIKLFSENSLDIIGLSNYDKKSYVEEKIKLYRSKKIKVLYDNDAHEIDSLDNNCFWIKGSKRNFLMIKEALIDYDIAINLMQNFHEKQYIKGIYIEKSNDGFLFSKQDDGFCLNFSDALNCLIGGRGTGKSSVLEILEYVLSQKCSSERLLEFICAHGNTWVVYVYHGEEYIIEMRMPYKENESDNILKFFGQNQDNKFNYRYSYNPYNIEEYAYRNYLNIFKITFKSNELWIDLVSNKKEMLKKFFDTRYSINELVNTASGEDITRFLYDVLFKNKTLARPSDSIKIRSKSGLKNMLSDVKNLLQQRRVNVNAIIEPFNENQVNILRIIYKQDNIAHEPPLGQWMFGENYNGQKYYKNFNITQEDLIQYLFSLYDKLAIFSFLEMVTEENIDLAIMKINLLNYCTDMTTELVDRGVKEILDYDVSEVIQMVFNELITDSNIHLVIDYLKEYVQDIEEFSLEFNLNNKEGTIKQNPLYRDVRKLSLGQKVVAMLSFILGYSEYSKDYRPLIIDQPEDNLDNQYIYKNLVKQLRCVKDKRQVIIATHNATIVTNAKAEQVCVMKSDNQHGWVDITGYPVETKIKKNIINYLEGGMESFLHKLNVYEEALGICITKKE